jgi:hypothetical protein
LTRAETRDQTQAVRSHRRAHAAPRGVAHPPRGRWGRCDSTCQRPPRSHAT